MRSPHLRIAALLITAYAAIGYSSLLVMASLTSRERVLPPGARYAFCGFYLDCHLGVSLEQIRVEPVPGGAAQYRVRVRVDSDAVRARLGVRALTAVLEDAQGRRYRAVQVPAAMSLGPGDAAHGEFVFVTPGPIEGARLRVQMGHWIERLVETFLVGDVDSLLHKRVYLALEPATPAPG